MALSIVGGDVFNELLAMNEAKKPIIFVHGCNAQGVMGSGVAALVKKLYPCAYEAYKREHHNFGLHLGDVHFVENVGSYVTVCNAITQKNYGRDGKLYVNYDALVTAMFAVANEAKERNVPVYLPLIGGGLGGGDVKRLTAIFQAVFHDVDATLFLKEG